MISFFSTLGEKSIGFVSEIGLAFAFLLRSLLRKPRPFKTFPLLIEQMFSIGVLSIVIIVVSGIFIGMVVSLQGHHTLSKFGADSELGQLLALSITRELAPVITALLFAGRAGSALTAEIGLMKATEQLSSMEMMGVDPLWRVISPRFWAGVISLPLLTLLFSAVAIWGGYLVGVPWLGIDGGTFWSNMSSAVNFQNDVVGGIIKSFVFAFAIIWVAVYQGFASKPTSDGISRATTKTVVYSSLLILGLDFVLTAVMLGGW